jgi:hypothetical protein
MVHVIDCIGSVVVVVIVVVVIVVVVVIGSEKMIPS